MGIITTVKQMLERRAEANKPENVMAELQHKLEQEKLQLEIDKVKKQRQIINKGKESKNKGETIIEGILK